MSDSNEKLNTNKVSDSNKYDLSECTNVIQGCVKNVELKMGDHSGRRTYREMVRIIRS